MLKRVASKRTTALLNKLNKSSAIHPGPGWSPAHVDQRLPAAACNMAQWRKGGGGEEGPQGLGWWWWWWRGSTQGLPLSKARARKELCTNAAATPAQKPPPPLLEHHPHRLGGWRWRGGIEEGVGSTLRLDILSVDGTIIWEEMGDALMQA